MPNKIDETLRNLAAGMPPSGKKPNSPNGNHDDKRQPNDLPGDPDCPLCHGVGYLRRDLPVGHPDFGKLEICTCRQGDISRQVRQRLFALSHLDELQHLTFENFEPRGRFGVTPYAAESIEAAYNHARRFAQSLKGWLLLQGTYGSGKTHLAAAIANFAVSMGVPTLFITVPDLLDSMRAAYQRTDMPFDEYFDEVRNAGLLILDDFGTQNATPWAQEKLFQIINYRYINQLPLVVTTNLEKDAIEERIQSRLEDPELVTYMSIRAPDYRNPVKDTGHHPLSSLGLHHNQTFASFSLREAEGLPVEDLRSLEAALSCAQQFAQQPRGWLVLTGPYGCGKTHLAAAIANARAEVDRPPLFVVVPDLLDHLRATFNPNSGVRLDRMFEEVRTAPLLVLDDLGTQSSTPWAQEKLYQLFNYRYNAELPTVITFSAYKSEMDQRLLSRMQDARLCRICPITAPSFRGTPPAPTRRPRRSPKR